MLLEVIIQSVADARAAAEGGADRLEIVRSIRDGGLTPPLSLVRAIAAETRLPLRVMVRENAGYAMQPHELDALTRAARDFADEGVDGIVVGFERGGTPALDDLTRVLEAAPGVRATFHRAFDALLNPFRAIDALSGVPQVDQILTSGGDGTAEERCARLREYVARGGQRIAIVAGFAVDDAVLTHFVRTACVHQVHVGRAARERAEQEGPVSVSCVRRLRRICDGDVGGG